MSFVHLHLHTEFSLVDGVCRIQPLVKAVADMGMPALAVTDLSNMFAMVKFYKAARTAGIKPIIGVECLVVDDKHARSPSKLILLSQDINGYRNLTQLVSRSYIEGQIKGVPTITKTWIAERSQGLIALSGGVKGDIGRALCNDNKAMAKRLLQQWQHILPDRFYLEIIRTGRAEEEKYLHACIELARQYAVPVAATNDVRFLTENDFEIHETRVCISESSILDDPRRTKKYSDQQYLRSAQEMTELFSDVPEAIENTSLIAQRCNLELNLSKNFLPSFAIPDNHSTEQYLTERSHEGLRDRLNMLREIGTLRKDENVYRQRLDNELQVITKMGFSGYFLIVADFVRWARENEVPVGPGRGSGAGSLAAYALGITDLDPIFHDLLFERFLNPERVSMPDFDIDFCMEGRDRVIEYVTQRYGNDKVSQIITYGTMAAKAVVRDVNRVMGNQYTFGDRLAKLIPFKIDITLQKALSETQELRNLYEQDDQVRAVIDLAKSLEGIARNAGRHAGGVVISPSALTDFTPLYCEEDGANPVTQLDKDDVESIGLVKFDFLGLRTLSIIDWTIHNIAILTGENIDIRRIPDNDEDTFNLLKACDTTAVFQLESYGMKKLIKRLQPNCFEDIVALVALYRPGPLGSGMVNDFISRKQGKEPIEYLHPELKPILKSTYGVILYQEQVMQIAQTLAGYTLGGADILRRAMGKKKPEVMNKQRAIFIKGMLEKNANKNIAEKLFDQIKTFADYGFNKSHSVAYALLSYQTAWLKAKHPSAFMAAVLSADMDNTDKIIMLLNECRKMGLSVLPPNINQSDYKFMPLDNDTIIYGLGAIKGMGEIAVKNITGERKAHGRYSDLLNFCARCDLQKLSHKVFCALIQAGAMDSIEHNRAALLANLDSALQLAEQQSQNNATGQDDMFGLVDDQGEVSDAVHWQTIQAPEWSDEERLAEERRALGLYLTGHPINRYATDIRYIATHQLNDVDTLLQAESADKKYGRNKDVALVEVKVAGLIEHTRTITKSKEPILLVELDDGTGRLEIILRDKNLERFNEYLVNGNLVLVEGGIYASGGINDTRLIGKKMMTIEQARTTYARYLMLNLEHVKVDNVFFQALRETMQPYQSGVCPVRVFYKNKDAVAHLKFSDKWHLKLADTLLDSLQQLLGAGNARPVY